MIGIQRQKIAYLPLRGEIKVCNLDDALAKVIVTAHVTVLVETHTEEKTMGSRLVASSVAECWS
jgi:hypothetical protein